MVKVDIVRKIQLKEGLSFQDAERLVTFLLQRMKETLIAGENLKISGFGNFELRDKKQRPGRDPKSKKEYEISARRVVTFSPSKKWREELNGSPSE